MSDKESWIDLTSEHRKEISQIIEAHHAVAWYDVLPKEKIPHVFSPVLRGKCDHAVVMYSSTTTASTVFVCNAERVDQKASAIDQEPFGVAVLGNEPASCGLLLHHGSWVGRSVSSLPTEFWTAVASSGVGNHFPFPELPRNTSGPLSELSQGSHGGAFKEMVARLARWRSQNK
jgi:hypothetical protein